MNDLIKERITSSIETKKRILEDKELLQNIESLVSRISESIRRGGKVIFFGNGGSASDAQHLACEFVVKLKDDRSPLPAIALTANTSILTAASNDYSFDSVFSRQIAALGKSGDVAVGISTSGNSKNVILALEESRKKGVFTAGLTGRSGGKMKDKVDLLINVPSDITSHIQEAHILIGHIICELVEADF